MVDLSKYSEVIFDCDGVILDSNKVKSEAFALALLDEDKELVDKFVLYHKKNGGISRFVKFEHFFKVMKGQKDYRRDLQSALDRYSQISFEGLLKCEEIVGVRRVLEQLNNDGISCYVTSGGEQNEVRSVLNVRNFSGYFKDIYGSPDLKEEHLKRIPLRNALYFGDSMSDYNAAQHASIDFAYIFGASEWRTGIAFCEKNFVPCIKDFESVM